MKEICIDARMAFHSGIGTYIRNIIPRIKKYFKLRLITHPDLIPEWEEFQQSDLILTSAPIYSIEEQLKFPLLVPKTDLFWSPHYNIPLSPLRAKKRIATIHDVCHLVFGGTHSLPKRLYAKLVLNAAVRMSDHLLTISEFSKEEIVKYTGVSSNKISPIPLGVDHSLFAPSSLFLETIQLPEKYFLFVSTLAPHKNVSRLLAAWSLVIQEFPDWKLVLVGKKTQDQEWINDLNRNNFLKTNVVFLEHARMEALPTIYTRAYALIHPSLYEGFGLTPLEAMSCGCPTIVSNAASMPEVCGDSTVYVDPHNVEDIASKMKTLICDQTLRKRLQVKGLQKSQQFSWDKTAEKTMEILDKFS